MRNRGPCKEFSSDVNLFIKEESGNFCFAGIEFINLSLLVNHFEHYTLEYFLTEFITVLLIIVNILLIVFLLNIFSINVFFESIY